MAAEILGQDENLRLAELRFRASRGDAEATVTLKTDLIARKALPFYLKVATELVSSF